MIHACSQCFPIHCSSSSSLVPADLAANSPVDSFMNFPANFLHSLKLRKKHVRYNQKAPISNIQGPLNPLAWFVRSKNACT